MPAGSEPASVVRVTVDADRMPHSTEMRRIVRGVALVYYMLLYATDDRYADRDELWKSWFRVGFGTAVQTDPDAASADRLHVRTESDGSRLTVTATAGNSRVVDAVAEILRRAEALGPELRNESGAARGDRLLADAYIADNLVAPVAKAMGQLDIPDEDARALDAALRRTLVAWTHPTIRQVRIEETSETAVPR